MLIRNWVKRLLMPSLNKINFKYEENTSRFGMDGDAGKILSYNVGQVKSVTSLNCGAAPSF